MGTDGFELINCELIDENSFPLSQMLKSIIIKYISGVVSISLLFEVDFSPFSQRNSIWGIFGSFFAPNHLFCSLYLYYYFYNTFVPF